jgi:hypothetical protein
MMGVYAPFRQNRNSELGGRPNLGVSVMFLVDPKQVDKDNNSESLLYRITIYFVNIIDRDFECRSP